MTQSSKPIVRRIGNSSEWNEKIRSIRQGGPDAPAAELSKRIGITREPTKRLVILAAGSFQQFTWGLLGDEDGRSLAKHKTALILANSLIEVAGWGESSAIPARTSLLFANPDLQPQLAMVRQTKSLQALEGRLVWTADDERNAAQEGTAFRSLFADSKELVANKATESELKKIQNPFALHIRTHGAYLEDQTQVPAPDRSLMLFSPGATAAGITHNGLNTAACTWKRYRAEIRDLFGYREATAADAEMLSEWLRDQTAVAAGCVPSRCCGVFAPPCHKNGPVRAAGGVRHRESDALKNHLECQTFRTREDICRIGCGQRLPDPTGIGVRRVSPRKPLRIDPGSRIGYEVEER